MTASPDNRPLLVLAPTIRHAFHALALGEDRKDFLPSLWYLPAPGKEAASDHDRRSGQVLRQVNTRVSISWLEAF